MAKSLWHSELVKLGPVKVTVKSGVLESTKKAGSFYVTLNVNGEDRYYNPENQACEEFFNNRVGQTISVVASGREADALLTLVGEELPRQAPKPASTRTQPPQHHDSNPPGRPGGPPAAEPQHATGMRAKSIRYGYKAGLPNFSSEYIEIEVELEPGVKAADALEFARKFVHSQIQWPK